MNAEHYTWTSGKIAPKPAYEGLVCENFIVVRRESETAEILTFWFGIGWDDDAIVSAWCPIPMDGIDEAIKVGDE